MTRAEMSTFERTNPRFMAYTASAMWGAAGLDGVLEGVLPHDPPFALVPVIAALVMFCVLVTVGPRLPRRWLAMLGPLGVAAISYALSQAPGAGDGAVLYTMPVLWTTFFYGRRGAVGILGCVAIGHATALMLLPASSVYPGRWLDVMVSVTASAIVVLALEGRNQALLGRVAAEARTDPLTGVLNRRGLEERGTVEIAHARRDDSPVALAVFDLDHFKRINDRWGHETGDRVLVNLARVLMREARDIDTVARTGGEEFVVLLPDTDLDGAHAFTDRVRTRLADAAPSQLPAFGISAGIVSCPRPDDLATLLAQADSAMYAAKRAGRDRTLPWVAERAQYVAA
ncbi:MAG TPA: GGDEF domain-containing protein [Solirubrobacteraceae bacterium]|nr:GGDEF domain-containing protein [Solirubrobacteraceae bacterium]